MTVQEFRNKFSIPLNQQQLAAVLSIEQPTLLLAVPGSGKTTVLVTRLGYMIYCLRIPPEKILTVTYTVAATKDMKKRFSHIFSEEVANRLAFRTINGICAKIISFYGEQMGKKAYELVTQEGFKMKLLAAIYVLHCNDYPTESELKTISTLITFAKNIMLTLEEIEKLGKEQDLPLLALYQEYGKQMREQSLMDYDDQMLYAYRMLKSSPQLLAYYQQKYPYICIDEAQDTSRIQHEIIKLLSGKKDHLFMVGDEDQSIYGFRAAYPKALLDFEKDHPNANVLLMEENYRSNGKIVLAANRFIQKNEFRHKKFMRPARDEKSDIHPILIRSRKEQYQALVKVAAQAKKDTALLYRDNESVLPVIDLLERENIPYRIKNADLSFFSHRIVTDMTNIIIFAANPSNTEIFMQIYYKIGLYINKTTAIEACRISETSQMNILDGAVSSGKLPNGTLRAIKAVKSQLQKLVLIPGYQVVRAIVNGLGYGAYLERAKIKDTKIQILEAIAENEPSGLRFVERLQELSTILRDKQYDIHCNFLLSTIHSSKGLEYDQVYLMDVKDGIFPEKVITNRKKATQEELEYYEEERRLFYVGVTRAKNQLSIFAFAHGSTFYEELFGIEKKEKPNLASEQYRKQRTMLQKNPVRKESSKRIVTESEYLDKLEEIRERNVISHRTFGTGRVISCMGDTLVVDFSSKTIKLKLKYMMEHNLVE